MGRVQTPTLAMLVERELAIRAFVPEDYLEVLATFHARRSRRRENSIRAPGSASRSKDSIQMAMRLPADGEEAAQIVARARTGAAPSNPSNPRRSAWRRRCSTI